MHSLRSKSTAFKYMRRRAEEGRSLQMSLFRESTPEGKTTRGRGRLLKTWRKLGIQLMTDSVHFETIALLIILVLVCIESISF